MTRPARRLIILLLVGVNVPLAAWATFPLLSYSFARFSQASAYLKPDSATVAGNGVSIRIGTSVTIDSVINSNQPFLVVGAPYENSNTGAIYIYRKKPGGWSFETKISGTTSGYKFGYSLAMVDTKLLVGAPGYGSGSGAVYCYKFDGTNWNAGGIATTGATAGSNFGAAIAYDGFFAMIGAPFDSTTAASSGAVVRYYDDNSSGIQYLGVLKAPAGEIFANANFGASVSVSFRTMVVGVPGDASVTTTPSGTGTAYTGAAYLYYATDSTTSASWTKIAYLKGTRTSPPGQFGYSVAVSEEDGLLVIGEPYASIGGNSNAGTAWYATGTAGSWTGLTQITPGNSAASTNFGYSVAVSGKNALIGAMLENSAATGITRAPVFPTNTGAASGSGAAYHYQLKGTTLNYMAHIKAPNPSASDGFGSSVSISPWFMVVGAPMEDSNLAGATNTPAFTTNEAWSNSGAVYIYQY